MKQQSYLSGKIQHTFKESPCGSLFLHKMYKSITKPQLFTGDSKIAPTFFQPYKNNPVPILLHLCLCIPIFFDSPFLHELCGHDMTVANEN